MIKIIDNFLTEGRFSTLYNSLLDSNFPWYLNRGIVYPRGEEVCRPTDSYSNVPERHDIQFTHLFFGEGVENSTYFYIVKDLLELLSVEELIRIKANLTVGAPEPYISGMHKDYEIDGSTTAVLYLTQCNGPTLFKDGSVVSCERNRALIFDGDKVHSGVLHTEGTPVRVVINFNYIEKKGVNNE